MATVITPGTTAAGVAIAAARSVLGAPYAWAGEGPDKFDCSGLVRWAYRKAGIDLPHQTAALLVSPKCKAVTKGELQPGDLVFPVAQVGTSGHVQIYTGNGQIIEANSSSKKVVERPMWGFYYGRRVQGAQARTSTTYTLGGSSSSSTSASAASAAGDAVLSLPIVGEVNVQPIVNFLAIAGVAIAGVALVGLGLARVVTKQKG